MKKTAMIFGAGQAGEMAAFWLPADSRLTAFIDNSPQKQGQMLCGVPVLSLAQAFGTAPDPEACAPGIISENGARPIPSPDLIYLAVINREARDSIRQSLLAAGFAGELIDVPSLRSFVDLRLAAIRLYAQELKESTIPGDIAELGVYRGETAAELNRLFPDRDLFLFDTFEGFDEQDLIIEKEVAAEGRNAKAFAGDFGDTSVEVVKARLPHPETAHFCKGRFPDSLALYPDYNLPDRRFALVSLDTDLYEPTLEGLRFFWPKMSRGGAIFIHDYNSSQYPGVKRAVRTFGAETVVHPLPLSDLHGTAILIKE